MGRFLFSFQKSLSKGGDSRGNKVDEVIVGCGASALALLYYAIKASFTKNGTTCVVIGKDDLWKKISKSDPGHRFGQPPRSCM